MKRLALFALAFSLLSFAWQALPQSRGSSGLDEVLRQLEAKGKTFQSFSARFAQKKYTAVLKEFDTPESGIFEYARAKDGSALLRQEMLQPGKRILTINGGVATIYQPTLKHAQVVHLGKNKDKAEFLVLGLGQSPGRLRGTFDLSYSGTEEVNKSLCSILQLRPKNPSAAAFFSAITLWIKRTNGVPIQQKLQEPNGDYLLVNFSEEKLNPKIPMSRFEQKLPSGTDVQMIR